MTCSSPPILLNADPRSISVVKVMDVVGQNIVLCHSAPNKSPSLSVLNLETKDNTVLVDGTPQGALEWGWRQA